MSKITRGEVEEIAIEAVAEALRRGGIEGGSDIKDAEGYPSIGIITVKLGDAEHEYRNGKKIALLLDYLGLEIVDKGEQIVKKKK